MIDEMDVSKKILSDLTIYSKYAKYIPELERRETWEECVSRNAEMHCKKFPFLKDEIYHNYSFVIDKKVLPSMRALQFSGVPIELNNSRIYNCSALPIDSFEAFHEIMFLLLSGCGTGYSVQTHHIENLPELIGPSSKTRKYMIGDSIIGWADAVKVLMKSFFFNKPLPVFDFSDIRKRGSILKTSGGKAPGPDPLKVCLFNIQRILENAITSRGRNTKLLSIEAHDIVCYIADCVLSGGIRRASCISLFSIDDKDMLESKFDNWYETNPQRARSNNSVVLLRHKTKKRDFEYIWERIKASGTGEPGIFWSNDKFSLVNPCFEASLDPFSFCNLTTLNVSNIESQEDLNERTKAVSFIGTLQASYTDFHYLRPIWKETTERNSLLGISMTGIASNEIYKYDCAEAAKISVEENERVSKLIGISPAKRITLIKPEGTSSLVLGTSSGIHPWHSKYYIRRMRYNKEENVFNYLKETIPQLIEDDFFKPETDAVVSIPISAPNNSSFKKDVSPLDLLSSVLYFHKKWILPGHKDGDNTHNVSVTVSIKEDEWDKIGEWAWEHRHECNGFATLPFDGGKYIQAPFEEIDEEKFNDMVKYIKEIDLSKVLEKMDQTDHKSIISCIGGKCEI